MNPILLTSVAREIVESLQKLPLNLIIPFLSLFFGNLQRFCYRVEGKTHRLASSVMHDND